jgi:hypothetical protein
MAFAYITKVTETLDKGQLIVRGYDVTGLNKGTLINLYVTQKVEGLDPNPRLISEEVYCPDVDLSEFLTSFPSQMVNPSGNPPGENLGNNTRREVKAMGLSGVPKGVLLSSRTIARITENKIESDIIISVELTFIPNSIIGAGPEIISS